MLELSCKKIAYNFQSKNKETITSLVRRTLKHYAYKLKTKTNRQSKCKLATSQKRKWVCAHPTLTLTLAIADLVAIKIVIIYLQINLLINMAPELADISSSIFIQMNELICNNWTRKRVGCVRVNIRRRLYAKTPTFMYKYVNMIDVTVEMSKMFQYSKYI